MPWCPKCRIEYQKEFKVCNDCNVELVERLEPLKEEEYDHEAFLSSVKDELEASVVEALLKANGVSVLRKYKEAGAYMNIYMGNTFLGIDLYVPEKQLDEAKEILNGNQIEMPEPENPVGCKEQEQEYLNKRRMSAGTLALIFFGIPVVIGIISLIYFVLGN